MNLRIFFYVLDRIDFHIDLNVSGKNDMNSELSVEPIISIIKRTYTVVYSKLKAFSIFIFHKAKTRYYLQGMYQILLIPYEVDMC